MGWEKLLVSCNPSGMTESSPSPPRRIPSRQPEGRGVPAHLAEPPGPAALHQQRRLRPGQRGRDELQRAQRQRQPRAQHPPGMRRERAGMRPGSCSEPWGGERRAGTSAGLGWQRPLYEALSRGDEPSLGARPTSRFPSLPRGRSHFPFPFCLLFFFFSPPFPGFAAKRRTGLAGMLGREAPLSQAPRAGSGAGGRELHPPPRGTHITPLDGEARPSPHHPPSTQGCGSPHSPLGGAPAVRGSVPSGQCPGPPRSPRARHRAGGS